MERTYAMKVNVKVSERNSHKCTFVRSVELNNPRIRLSIVVLRVHDIPIP